MKPTPLEERGIIGFDGKVVRLTTSCGEAAPKLSNRNDAANWVPRGGCRYVYVFVCF
jgi:hypothetical protein